MTDDSTRLSNLRLPLFLTRLSIFAFLLPWQLMRFTRPEGINNIAQKYYKFSMPDIGSTISGVLMMALLIAFVVGFKKRISYGLVALIHGIGTAMTIPALIPGHDGHNQLFLAAMPALMAMVLLYLLRNEDTLFAVEK